MKKINSNSPFLEKQSSQYDQQQLLLIKKLNEKLQEEEEQMRNFRILNWNNHKFSYAELDTSILRSPFTDSNERFQECIKMIEDYNKEMKKCLQKGQEIKNGPQKNKFYGTLLNLCREVMFTKDDRLLQKYFTEKIYKWAFEYIDIKDDNQKLIEILNSSTILNLENNQQNKLQSRRSRVITQMSTIDATTNKTENLVTLPNLSFTGSNQIYDSDLKTNFINKTVLPNDKIKQMIKPYIDENRTKYTDIPPPNERLQQFRKKNIIQENRSKTIKIIAEKEKQIINSTILYPKPTGYLPIKAEQQNYNLNESDENKNAQQVLNQQNEDEEEEVEKEVENNKATIMMTPEKKPFINHLQYKQIGLKQSNQFNQKSTFQYYIPENNLAEQRMEQKWLIGRKKILEETRENEEISQIMGEWSYAKSKIDQEINNKINRQQDGSNFSECVYRPRIYTLNQKKNILDKIRTGTIQEDEFSFDEKQSNNFDSQNQHSIKPKTIDYSTQLPNINSKHHEDANNSLSQTERLEYKISKQRVKNARSVYSQLLNLIPKEDEDVIPNMIPSVSVYQQKKVKLSSAFSSVFDKYNPDYMRKEQIQEVYDIKNRMARYKINIPIKKLMDSIVIPENLKGEALNNLPSAGMGLLENPNQENQKKKSKKK